jgi:spoIIIJ-associated protein
MSVYKEFVGKTVEEAIKAARDEFGVATLDDLDFEILTPGSRGVLGMGAEPARILAAPRSALGGAAPKREAAAQQTVVSSPPRGPQRAPEAAPQGRREAVPTGRPGAARGAPPGRPAPGRPAAAGRPLPPRAPEARPGAGAGRGPGRGGTGRRPAPRPTGGARTSELTAADRAELAAARAEGGPTAEQLEVAAAQAAPEALEAGRQILSDLMALMGYRARVEVIVGETNRLNVVGEGSEKEALGALIGRKGERLSALQHIVNLLLAKRMGEWTRVLVDVEDYRGRRERQLRELAQRAARRVLETGRMLQLEPMPALERRWVHLALRDHPEVTTQSIGEEPNRRVVILPRHL